MMDPMSMLSKHLFMQAYFCLEISVLNRQVLIHYQPPPANPCSLRW